MNKYFYIFGFILLSGCAKSLIPIPSVVIPEYNDSPDPSASYGKYPSDFQVVLKNFLKKNLLNADTAKVDFVNKPAKIAITHLNKDKYGYRVCLAIESKNNKGLFVGFRNHFFLINNGDVSVHLYDSGLLKIPFELCIARSERTTIYLEDIDEDESFETTIDEMDQYKPEPKKSLADINNDIYISCIIEDRETTYVFNEKRNTFTESIKMNILNYSAIEFSKTHIYAEYQDKEILINRVSGKFFLKENNLDSEGQCELKDSRKF